MNVLMPSDPFVLFILLWIIIFLRYFIFALFFQFYFYKLKFEKYSSRIVEDKEIPENQKRLEITYSAITSGIFAGGFTHIYFLWLNQKTLIYSALEKTDLWYLPLSLIIVCLLHETYYYWAHRFMHHPTVYEKVHRVHHMSLRPSPWTSFSFHPLETIIQIGIFYIVVLTIPLHPITILFYLLLMTLSSLMNHLNIEIFPIWICKSWIGKFLIGATHHTLHHKYFKKNFGLYFTFWDRICSSESDKLEFYFKKMEKK